MVYVTDLKRFLAVYLSVMVSVSAFAVVVGSMSEKMNAVPRSDQSKNHFSVVWMGFQPSYNNSYADYYICINDLKDDILKMKISLRIQNFENTSFWFSIGSYTSPPAGWTVDTLYIGLIGIDATKDFVYSNVTRARPDSISQGRVTESVELVVKAYYDPSYLNFYSQANFSVRFHLIDITSPDWVTLYHDNFDDGTNQGWQSVGPADYFAVESYTYYRSWPNSLKISSYPSYSSSYLKRFDTTGPYAEAYLVYSIRSTWGGFGQIDLNGTTYFKPDLQPATDTWYQVAIPLPLSKVTEAKIYAVYSSTDAWLDEVYVVAK